MQHRTGATVVRAGVAAGVLSGVPSTIWAIATGRDPLEAARAAGTLVPGFRPRGGVLPGLAVHGVITAAWTAALAAVLPRSRTPTRGALWGGLAGAAVAALDLGVLARPYPAVRSLPQPPQWADHVAFGAVAGAVLAGPARCRRRTGPRP